MSRLLTHLLGLDNPHVSSVINDYERATGKSSIDVRLIADTIEATHQALRQLRLDIADSTAEEIYNGLNAAVRSGQAELLLTNPFALLEIDRQIISFNLEDVIENAHHQMPFKDRVVGCGQRALRRELVSRYTAKAAHPEVITAQSGVFDLDTDDDTLQAQADRSSEDVPYVLAIGDIFTDAFIKLSDEVARIDTDPDGSKRISLPFGSKPPYEQVDVIQSVGPSPNAAVSFARLGLRAGLMSYLGDDLPGKDSLAYLKKENVDVSTVSAQTGIKSNYYYVLRLGAERTILVKNEDYRYDWQEPSEVPDWIYLSLISESAWQLHEDLLRYLQAHPDTKLAFQPGTFHFKWGVKKLAPLYKRSHIIVLNREEAVEITGGSYDDLHALAEGLHDLGPKVVVVTDGPHGSYASFDGRLVTIPNYPDPAPPLDRTGAGDAFASTIVAALALGESVETALSWAPINSMSVVQQLGAQGGLLHKTAIERYTDDAPADYKITEMKK